MDFKELTEQEISDFIVNDPGLVYMGFTDKELMYMYENKKYLLHPQSHYIGIVKDEVLIGILKWEYFTDVAITVHPYISTNYQGKGLAKEMSRFVTEHLLKNTEIKKVMAFIGDSCEPAIRAVKACGFFQEAFIDKCQVWRQQLGGVYVFSLNLEDN